MFVTKSKPIAKSLLQSYVIRWEIFGVRVPGYPVKFKSFVHPGRGSMGKHNQGMAIGTGFPTINAGSTLQKYCPDVRNQMRWPHNGLACGGEGLGPKQESFGESKSTCGSDCGELLSRSFPNGCCAEQQMGS